MVHPNHLPEDTLAAMYKKADIDERKKDFFHKLFLASANLYGNITLNELWQICKKVVGKYGMEDLQKKDLIAFSSIVMHEDTPYHIYEKAELHPGEKGTALSREILHPHLIGFNITDPMYYSSFQEMRTLKPYCVPENILSFAEGETTEEETALLEFFSSLTSTVAEYGSYSHYRETFEHVGKKLSEFSYMNYHEQSLYREYSGADEKNPVKDETALEDLVFWTSGNEAEKIVRYYIFERNMNSISSLDWVMRELQEVGVRLTDEEFQRFQQLIRQLILKTHVWGWRGWSPEEIEAIQNKPDLTRSVRGMINQVSQYIYYDYADISRITRKRNHQRP